MPDSTWYAHLNEAQLNEVRAHLQRVELDAHEIIIDEGEDDQTAILIESGEVRIERDGVTYDHSGPGELIGEMAMFGDGRRTARVVTTSPVTCVIVDIEGYEALRTLANPFAFWLERAALEYLARRLRRLDTLIAEGAEGEANPWIKPPPSLFRRLTNMWSSDVDENREPAPCNVPDLLFHTRLFSGTSWGFLMELARQFEHRAVPAGHRLCEQGTEGDCLFIVASGAVDVLVCTSKDAREVKVFKLGTAVPGDAVGLSALVDGAPRAATCVATTPVDVLVLDREAWTALRNANNLFGSEMRRAVIRGLALSLAEAAGHLVGIERQSAGRPTVPMLPLSAGPLDTVEPVPIDHVEEEDTSPVRIYVAPDAGIAGAVAVPVSTPSSAARIRAASAAEISIGPR